MIQKTTYFNLQALTVLAEHLGSGGYSGPLYNLSAILIQQPFNPLPSTNLAAITECNYSGYARQAGITWGTPILQPDGSYQILSNLMTWLAGSASNFVANNVYGWALIDTQASPNMYLVEAFANAIPLASPGDGFGLVLQLSEGINNPQSFGNIIT